MTENTPTEFADESELLTYYEMSGEAWLSLVAADGQPYTVTCTEDGDIFTQTIRDEDNESGTSWLREHPTSWYPVTLVAPFPKLPAVEVPSDDKTREALDALERCARVLHEAHPVIKQPRYQDSKIGDCAFHAEYMSMEVHAAMTILRTALEAQR